MATAEALMTLEEFARMPDDGRRTELHEGRIVELPPPQRRHGRVCYRVASILGRHVDDQDLGTILINDAGIITRRDPDSVRGADVAYDSFDRLPQGPVPDSYFSVAPELVFEVRSSSDRSSDVDEKVAEYLGMGVMFVCVLDPDTQSIVIQGGGQAARKLGPDDELTFPGCLPGFQVIVRRFFA